MARFSLQVAKDQLTKQFSEVMATLGDASTTDKTLGGFVSTFNEKTSEFQELTGALLETKSVAMLFEGAERLKQRTTRVASQILNAEQVRQNIVFTLFGSATIATTLF